MDLIYNPNISFNNDDTYSIIYDFNTPTDPLTENGTNFLTQMSVGDVLIIYNDKPIKNICNINIFDDTLVGDTDYLYAVKDFKFSYDKYNYTNWLELNETNLKLINETEDLYLVFRYTVCEIDSDTNDYNTLIYPITKPNNSFISKVHVLDDYYTFDKDYPNTGEYSYEVGYGTNGQIHYNDVTDRFLVKNNGYWGSGLIVEKNGDTYIPSTINGYEINSETVGNATTAGFDPIDDYYLSIDLMFGNLDDNVSSIESPPRKDDNILLNTALQNIQLNGGEYLKINHERRVLEEDWITRLYLDEININASQAIPNYDSDDALICLENKGDHAIFSPDMTIKAFSFDSFCIKADGYEGTNCLVDCLDVKFRYSTTTRRWETDWIPLTLANIKCIKPSPLKFFYIEFLFVKTCDNNGKPICITDLILNGDYQNISNDYEKLNRFGLRADCNYGLDSEGGTDHIYDPESGQQPPIEWTDQSTCPTPPSFNPYDFNLSNHLYEKLANDVSNIFGWDIDYYKVDPDNAGIDNVLHEYTTYNTTDKKNVKVMIPENNFPEDQIGFNMFDLAMFDSFEVHITRKEFHNKFGIGVRPANQDYMFMCPINKWYTVEHAQSFREFNNTSVYYKLILTKKQDSQNIDSRDYTDFKEMSKNNSLDNLFGNVVSENINDVSNKEIQENLTERVEKDVHIQYEEKVEIKMPVNATSDKDIAEETKEITNYKKPDPVSLKIYAKNVEYDLINAANIISRNYYDLTSRTNQTAIVYQKLDTIVEECENRSFTTWFNINEYVNGQVYNFIDNYNTVEKTGYKIDFIDGRIEIVWDKQFFEMDVSVALNKWFGLMVNFNQRQHKIDIILFRRQKDGNCSDMSLDIINQETYDLKPSTFTGDLVMSMKGSQMFFTNLRVYNDVIPQSQYDLFMNRYVIKDTGSLILADNCVETIISPHHKF